MFVKFGTIFNQNPILLFLLLHINFNFLASFGKSLKWILMTLTPQIILLVFTQKIEPSVMISPSLSEI